MIVWTVGDVFGLGFLALSSGAYLLLWGALKVERLIKWLRNGKGNE